MKAYKPLQEAFNKLDQSTVSWFKHARFPKTAETANAVLYRDAIVDASTLAYLGHCLGLSNKQVVAVLDQYAAEVPKKAGEVAVLKKLIAPVDLTDHEQEMLGLVRKLSDEKRGILENLVRSMK